MTDGSMALRIYILVILLQLIGDSAMLPPQLFKGTEEAAIHSVISAFHEVGHHSDTPVMCEFAVFLWR